MRYVAIGLVVLVVFLSGCIELPFGIQNPFGSDVIDISTSSEKIGTNDVIKIKDVSVVPHPPMLPNQEIVFSVLIESNAEQPVNNVFLKLYDAPNFHNLNGQLCNRDGCFPESDYCSENEKCTMSPNEEREILFRLITPNKKKASMPTLSYSLKYSYSTPSTLTIPIVNTNEVIKRQKAGQGVVLSKKLIVGEGPVQVDIKTRDNFILSEQDSAVIFQVKDTGSGIDIDIEKDKLKIEFPRDIGDIKPPGNFDCKDYVCTNNQKISLLNKKSSPLYFLIKNIKNVDVFETQIIRARVSYVYEIRGSKTLEIRPYGT